MARGVIAKTPSLNHSGNVTPGLIPGELLVLAAVWKRDLRATVKKQLAWRDGLSNPQHFILSKKRRRSSDLISGCLAYTIEPDGQTQTKTRQD